MIKAVGVLFATIAISTFANFSYAIDPSVFLQMLGVDCRNLKSASGAAGKFEFRRRQLPKNPFHSF
jgi:hypothetical protein